jgi:hypothetical protein
MLPMINMTSLMTMLTVLVTVVSGTPFRSSSTTEQHKRVDIYETSSLCWHTHPD